MTLILGVTVQAAISEAGGSASVRLLDSTKTTLSGGHPVIRPQMSRAVACWSQSTEQQLKLQSSYEKNTNYNPGLSDVCTERIFFFHN